MFPFSLWSLLHHLGSQNQKGDGDCPGGIRVFSVPFPETFVISSLSSDVGFGVSAVSVEGEQKPTLLPGEQLLGAQSAKAGDWRRG